MPRTEAGKRHALRHPACVFSGVTHTHNGECPDEALAEIDAIEAQAVAAARARIRAAVEARLRIVDHPAAIDSLRAVLRIIDWEDTNLFDKIVERQVPGAGPHRQPETTDG